MIPFSAEQILYEDNHLFIINKACSQLSQSDKSGDPPLGDSIKAFIKRRDHKPGNVFCNPAHRLDRPSSGIFIFAKTSKALSRMNRIFRDAQAQKFYWALVDAPPPEPQGALRHYLLKDNQRNKSRAFNEPGRGRREAVLSYTVTYRLENYFLLEIELHTGRHHQIRAQLAKINIHIRGDLKYGARRSNPDGGISLHARKMCLRHPVSNQKLTIVADPRRAQADTLWNHLPDSILR